MRIAIFLGCTTIAGALNDGWLEGWTPHMVIVLAIYFVVLDIVKKV